MVLFEKSRMNQRHPQSRPKIVQSGLRNQQMLSVCTAVVDWFGPSWPDSHLGSPHAKFCARVFRYFFVCYGVLPPLHRRRDGARDARAQQAHATVALLGSPCDPAWPHGHQGGWQRLSSGQSARKLRSCAPPRWVDPQVQAHLLATYSTSRDPPGHADARAGACDRASC